MTAHVRFDAVSVAYGAHQALDGITASVPRGACTAILGPNGSGKSTLLNLLTGHHARYAGRVFVDDRDIARMKPRVRAAEIGVLRQDSGPLPDVTVAELVALGPRLLGRTQTVRALEHVGLGDLGDRPISTLSGGQLQRALLARAIRHEPPLLVLDEPTNHLDVHHQIELLELVTSMGITVVSALHDLNLAHHYADHVLVLAAGAVYAEGTPRQTLTDAVVRDVFRVRGERVTAASGAEHLVLGRLEQDQRD